MKTFAFLLSFLFLLPSSLTAQFQAPEIVLQEGDYTDLLEIVYTADGSRVAGLTQYSQFTGTQVVVWDVRSGQTITRIQLESKIFLWNNTVKSLAISPEGRYLAVSQKRDIHVYDLNQPTIQAITGEQAKIRLSKFNPTQLAFSPDGRYLVAGGDEFARFTITAQKADEWPVERFGNDRSITSMEISGDGRFLAAGRKGRELEIWDLSAKSELRILEKAPRQVDLVSLSDDGRYIAASPEKRQLMLWDVQSGKLILEWKTDQPVNTLRFAPDGQTLVTSHPTTDFLSIWEVPSGAFQKKIPDVVNAFAKSTALSFSPHGRYLAVSDFNLKVDRDDDDQEKKSKRSRGFKILSYPDGRLVREINLQDPLPVFSLNLNEDATELVSYGADGYLKVWDLAAADLAFAEKMPGALEKLQFTTDLKNAAWFYQDRVEVGPFDPGLPFAERKVRYSLPASRYNLSSLVFSIDKRYLACIARDSTIHIWPLDRTDGVRPQILRPAGKDFVQIIQLSRDGRYLAGGRDSTFSIWDVTTARLLHNKVVVPLRERGISTEIIQFAPSTDGKTFYVNCKEKYIGKTFGTKVSQEGVTSLKFNVETGDQQLIAENLGVSLIEGLLKQMTSILLVEPYAISGDGQKFAMGESPIFRGNLVRSGSDPSKKVYVGDLAGLSTRNMFEVEIGNTEIQAIAINNNGRFLATGGNDGLIKLWNTEQKKLIAEIVHREGEYAFLLRQDPVEPYYKISRGAADLVAFRLGKNIYPFEAFDLQFNRHDKILEAFSDPSNGIIERTGAVKQLIQAYYRAYEKRRTKMKGAATTGSWQQPPDPVVIENLADLPIETQNRTVTFQVRATDERHGLQNIQVWVNDVPVFGRDGLPIEATNAHSTQVSFDLKLSNGINKVQLSSTNDQQVASLLETVYITYNGPAETPDLHLVVIGLSEYQNQDMNLFYPVKDVADLLALYQRQGIHYGRIQVHRLLNQEATLENIQALKAQLEQTKVDDRVLLFFAGHGLVDDQLDYYLATYDTDFQAPARRGLAYEDLEALLDGIPARNKVIFIDACHSGEIDKESVEKIKDRRTEDGDISFRSVGGGLDYQQLGLENSFELMKELFLDLRRGVGATVISSASGVEFAMEGDEWRNGVFTYCLLQGLGRQTADLDRDGQVMVSELQRFLSREVPALTDNNQRPTSRVENIANDFVLWKN